MIMERMRKMIITRMRIMTTTTTTSTTSTTTTMTIMKPNISYPCGIFLLLETSVSFDNNRAPVTASGVREDTLTTYNR